MHRTSIAAVAAICLFSAAAVAAPVPPVSYDMPNGNTGSYNYWDDTYSGSGDRQSDNAALTGGTGDLTDGVIATQNWNIVEPPRGPNGPYVGWSSLDPTITFFFDRAYRFSSVTFHFDDSNGAGGVAPPSSITVQSVTASIPDQPGGAPYSQTLDLSGLGETDSLQATITRSETWVFLSEVTFEADIAPVPVPAAGVLMLGALGGLAALRRRKAG